MDTLHAKRNKYLFLIVSFIFWFCPFIYLPVLSPYMEEMGGTYTLIGLVLGSYGLMQLLCRIPIGIFSDLMKVRKLFIIFGMLITTISCLAFAFTDSLVWILISRSLAGVAAATWVVFTVLYSSYFSDRGVHRAMGSISFVIVLAQLLGMSMSGYVVQQWGWHAPFWIGGVMGLIGILLSFFIFEPKSGIQREPLTLKDLLAIMKEPLLLKISLLSILAHSIIFTTMFGFIPAYVLEIGLEADDMSLIIFSFMIPHAIATLYAAKIFVPMFGKWNLLKMAFGLTAIFTLLTPFVHTKGWLIVFQGANGFGLGLLFPLLLGMAIETIPQEKRATAMGAYQALYAIGMFAGPFVAGILNSRAGISAGFYFSGILGAVAVILISFWNRRVIEVSYKVVTK